MPAKTGAERQAALVADRKARGLVEAVARVWVLPTQQKAVAEVMRRAGKRAIQK